MLQSSSSSPTATAPTAAQASTPPQSQSPSQLSASDPGSSPDRSPQRLTSAPAGSPLNEANDRRPLPLSVVDADVGGGPSGPNGDAEEEQDATDLLLTNATNLPEWLEYAVGRFHTEQVAQRSPVLLSPTNAVIELTRMGQQQGAAAAAEGAPSASSSDAAAANNNGGGDAAAAAASSSSSAPSSSAAVGPSPPSHELAVAVRLTNLTSSSRQSSSASFMRQQRTSPHITNLSCGESSGRLSVCGQLTGRLHARGGIRFVTRYATRLYAAGHDSIGRCFRRAVMIERSM